MLSCPRATIAASTAAEENSTEICALLGPLGGVAIQPDGKIVVAGGSYLESSDLDNGTCGVTTGGAFRFDQNGNVDRSFHCNIDTIGLNEPDITRLVSDTRGHLLMSGTFHSVDGRPRPGYAMLLPDGRNDDSFQPWRDFTNAPARTGVGGGVHGVALLSNDWVAVASFALDSPYPTAYRLDATGRFVPPPDAGAIPSKFPKALMFTLRPAGLGIQRDIDWTRNTATEWNDWPPAHIPEGVPFALWGQNPSARDMAEALQAIFEEVPLEMCRYAVRLPGGGYIMAVQESGGSHFVRFDQNWRPDLAYTNHFTTGVYGWLTLAVQPDGKLLVGGDISRLNGEPFTGLARLDRTGATDREFQCRTVGGASTAGLSQVMGMALQNDGRILIVGQFSKVNETDVPFLARLNPDGSLDQPFQRHFTSTDHLKVLRGLRVHNLAAASTPGHAAPGTGTTAAASELAAAVVRTIVITSWNVGDDVVTLQFQGNASTAYILQATSDLNPGSWVNLDTNQTTAAGIGILRDLEAKNHPTRLYRVAAP